MIDNAWYVRFCVTDDTSQRATLRSILHDEKVYGPRTEEFEPERFLQQGIIDPTAQFGFGRRSGSLTSCHSDVFPD